MSLMLLSMDLLDALLSVDNARRQAAEKYLSSVSAADQCRAWLQLWPIVTGAASLPLSSSSTSTSSSATTTTSTQQQKQQQQKQQQQQSAQAVQQHLLAILLRRSIVRLQDVSVLESLVSPLLHDLWKSEATTTVNARRAVGDALAELCAVWVAFSSTTPTPGSNPMQPILQVVGPLASQGYVPALELLIALAERAPKLLVACAGTNPSVWLEPLIASGFETTILQTTTRHQTEQNVLTNDLTRHQVDALWRLGFQLIVTVARTCTSSSRSPSTATTIATTTTMLDPSSPESQLGVTCLLPLLHVLTTTTTNPVFLPSLDAMHDMLHQCWDAAEQVPALLAGSELVLRHVWQWIAMVAATPTTASSSYSDTDLLAVQVVASLLGQPAVKQFIMIPRLGYLDLYRSDNSNNNAGMDWFWSILLSPASCQEEPPNLLLLCLHRMENGIDEDDDDDDAHWAAEPATYHADDAMGDMLINNDDDDANYAQELLAQLLETLSATRIMEWIVFPCCQAWLSTGHSATNRSRCQVRVALATLQTCVQVAPYQFRPNTSATAQVALHWSTTTSTDSSFRIQYQALQLLTVLLEITPNEVRSSCGVAVLQTMAHATHSSSTKIAALACLGLVSYARPPETLSRTNEDGSDEEEARRRSNNQYVIPYVSDVLVALSTGPLQQQQQQQQLIRPGHWAVQIRAWNAVACWAQACGSSFEIHYAAIMPQLQQFLSLGMTIPTTGITSSKQQHEEWVLCQGAALECATLVGQALADNNNDDNDSDSNNSSAALLTFRQSDAPQLMRVALYWLALESSNDNQNLHDNDILLPPLDQVLAACARIATVLRSDYTPYASTVLPSLLYLLQQIYRDVEIMDDQKLSIQEGYERDSDSGTDSMTVAIPGHGFTKVVVHSAKMQQKAQAARAVYEHAVALGAAFGPHVQPFVDVLVPFVSFPYSAEIRSTSAQTLGAVFESACLFDDDHETSHGQDGLASSVLVPISTALAKQISKEDAVEPENEFAIADSLCEVLRSIYVRQRADDGSRSNTLIQHYSLDQAQWIVMHIVRAMAACLERRTQLLLLQSSQANGSCRDEMARYQEVLRVEQDILTSLVDSIGYHIKIFRSAFAVTIESIVAPIILPLLETNRDARATLAAICLLDDCVEHGGTAVAAQYTPHLIKGISGVVLNCTVDDTQLLSACFYGLAQMARHAPDAAPLEQHLAVILPYLLNAANTSTNCDYTAVVRENAVSAMASLFLIGKAPFRANGYIKMDYAIRVFLQSLPLREDQDEAIICHAGLCDLVEQGVIRIDDGEQGEQLIRIISELLENVDDDDGEAFITEETCIRLTGILFAIQQDQRCAQQLRVAFQRLSVQGQEAVQRMMQRHAHHFTNVVTP